MNMKNNTLIAFILALFCCGTAAKAQIELRPKVGILWTSFEDVSNVDFSAKTGYSFGADLMIGSRIYLQPGFHYEGSNLSVDTDMETFDLNLQRFSIPLMIGYRFLEPETNEFLNFRLHTGPVASFLLNVDDNESQLDIDGDDFSTTTFDWNAGVGVDIFIFYLNAGYRFGLNNIFNDFNVGNLNVDSGTQGSWYVNAGLRIAF